MTGHPDRLDLACHLYRPGRLYRGHLYREEGHSHLDHDLSARIGQRRLETGIVCVVDRGLRYRSKQGKLDKDWLTAKDRLFQQQFDDKQDVRIRLDMVTHQVSDDRSCPLYHLCPWDRRVTRFDLPGNGRYHGKSKTSLELRQFKLRTFIGWQGRKTLDWLLGRARLVEVMPIWSCLLEHAVQLYMRSD